MVTSMLNLCQSLIEAVSEEEVIQILMKEGYWEDQRHWNFYGDNENNFSVIGNQQSLPESAIVEKIINSVDAVLMRECLKRKIAPESQEAPRNIVEALERFFRISQGSLWDINVSARKKLAENISFVATGKKESPCYSIIDLGEGQTPKRMPDTFLSLAKSNKLRIPFVQGKFNMGGTGVFQFAGRHNLQLILSKRDPEVAKFEDDETKDSWGFTVVRREDPKEGRRSSAYTYLTVDGNIPFFKASSLPLLPGEYPKPYGEPLEWGTFIKLYEYQMPGGLKTNILFDLYNRICLLLPKIALPIRFFERRVGYSGHTFETTMSGLSVRLYEDKRTNLEEGFPSSSTISVSGEKMVCQIFAFRKGQSEKYRKDEGIIFTVNGQTHGHIPVSFFSRKAVGMSYLADSILVTIDCADFSGRTREDLFMNSRDRLRGGDLKDQIERELEELLNNHPGLRALRERRRREEIQGKLEDSKPLKELLEDILKKSPALSSLLIPGFKIRSPFDMRGVSEKENFVGKDYPTYFRIMLDEVKLCPINSRFRIQYETDATNDYFERSKLPGEFRLCIRDEEVKDYTLNLWNGLATLTVNLPESANVGDTLNYKSVVGDPTQFRPFESDFQVNVIEPYNRRGGGHGETKKPPSSKEGDDRSILSSLSLPQVIEIHQNRWSEVKFTENSALLVKDTGDEGYDFYVNMDNICLLSEVKARSDIDGKLLSGRYKYALVLIGLALLKEHAGSKEEKKNDEDIFKGVSEVAERLSPIILPMISYLGELEIES
jgi:hypothetical protein